MEYVEGETVRLDLQALREQPDAQNRSGNGLMSQDGHPACTRSLTERESE
jgi:hypothetical protein